MKPTVLDHELLPLLTLILLIRPETLSSLREWLKQLPSYGMEAVECGSLTLDGPQIAAIEEAVLNMEVSATCIGLSKHVTYIASFLLHEECWFVALMNTEYHATYCNLCMWQ